jgi:predicted NBD/HSP70 family sugar kinase
MRVSPRVRAAHALLLHGAATREHQPSRGALLSAADLINTTFRASARAIGGQQADPGLRFFDGSTNGWFSFGPGAGVCVGVSVGARTVRAVLVDANGWEYAGAETDELDEQLAQAPAVVLKRIRQAVQRVLLGGLDDANLLVNDSLPLLGCAVAWPTPISRERRPVGHALADPTWNDEPLDRRVQTALGLEEIRTFVMSDAHAAAIAVAHRETRGAENVSWTYPRLTVVLRLAGNVSGAVIVVEPKRQNRDLLEVSGFRDSILLGGIDNQAGEIGHVPVSRELIETLNRSSLEALGPMQASRCSCTPADAQTPDHLEAYASVLALARRLYPQKSRGEALKAVQCDPNGTLHARALEDVGTLVGETMLAPVAMLNPAGIVLSGSLALPSVENALKERLAAAHKLGSRPKIRVLSGDENDNLRAKGAALAMIRIHVHRKFEELLGDERCAENVRALTKPIDRVYLRAVVPACASSTPTRMGSGSSRTPNARSTPSLTSRASETS